LHKDVEDYITFVDILYHTKGMPYLETTSSVIVCQ